MIEITADQFEKDFDKYMDAIEEGEEFLIRTEDGKAVVAVPAKQLEHLIEQVEEDEWYNLYSNHSEAS